MNHYFDYNITTVSKIDGLVDFKLIRDEPMVFQSDLEFTRKNCGQLTNQILDELFNKLPHLEEEKLSIDTRCTMTMVGQYPSIPNWHCDFVPRGQKYSQPDLTKISSSVQHYMCILSDTANHTCTEFVTDKINVEFDYALDVPIWSQLDKYVTSNQFNTRFISPGEIVQFDQNAIHRATKTQNSGWRLFFRLSTNIPVKNEIRKQVQVYTPLNFGW